MKRTDDLLKHEAFINGQWCEAESRKTFAVLNPADGKKIADVPDMALPDTDKAIEAAHRAFASWKGLTGKERHKIIYRWYELICDHAAELSRILTMEQGKPLAEAKGEVLGGAGFVEWFAEEAKRCYGDFIPAHKNDAQIVVSRAPVGVVGAITPWNFPSSMITRKVAPALAAGCTVVLKPAEDTPLSALALAALAEKAEFPPGVFNVVTSSLENAPVVGQTLTDDIRVKKISFTGSTEVGKILMKQCAGQVKKLSLELGGNAPFIVFSSADLDKAVDGAFACKFRNAGQTCISANRIYVQADIYEAFAKKFISRLKDIQSGAGDQTGVTMGPLINEAGLQKVEELLEDALEQGARVEHGGQRSKLGGTFFEPTVLTGMTSSMRMAREEIFGPVAALYSFETDEEVIERANDTEYGLASYIYSNDHHQVWRVSGALEYGMVAVNEPLLATELAPFGGVKESGMGREGSKYGLEAFTEIKYRLLGGI